MLSDGNDSKYYALVNQHNFLITDITFKLL